MIARCRFPIIAVAFFAQSAFAAEELITTAHYPNGEVVPYILNYQNLSPRYVVILFPGGTGEVNPRMEDGKLVYGFKWNFLLRTRNFIVDDEFVTVTTNASQSAERIQTILDDLSRRFPKARVYLMGTSRGTHDTMVLAGYLSDKIAGEIHTSSLDGIRSFDARKYKNRHLVVHHKYDGCRVTPFAAAQVSHEKYGNELIAMEGGTEGGDPCQPGGHHGYHGIEKETIDAIKQWIKRGG
ncbi:MAG: hypothetical protein ACRET8_02065 [Burkholderiales bacterium]